MLSLSEQSYRVDFPTLWVVAAWVSEHVPVPDGRRKGEPFVMYDWQLWCTVNHYRVKPTARDGQLATAFEYRRSQCIAPQKIGKGPWAAAIVAAEGVGPTTFAGWAGADDGYVCADHGCRCGWEYPYREGEPMGRPWATPLIQLLATSEDQPLALDTPVPTPTGWTTVGALQVGQQVLDAAGRPVEVVRETPVLDGLDCYEVVFSDGERIVASASHSWTLDRETPHGGEWQQVTVSTAELAQTYSRRGRKAYRTEMGIEWQLPSAELSVAPYLMGLWLGDGATGDATIAVDWRQRPELEALLEPLLLSWEQMVWRQGPGNSGTVRIRRRAGLCGWGHDFTDDRVQRACGPCRRGEVRTERRLSLRERLRETGVLGHKHIPANYLRASAEQRRQLLQGLMDSDGQVNDNGRAIYTTISDDLAASVCELLTSLGYGWRRRRDSTSAWRISFVPTAERPAACLQHKVARHRPTDRRRLSRWRSVVDVRPVASVPVRCIGLDTEDHLFLVGERAVPTHNTDNVFRPLQSMVRNGPLADMMRVGEEFIRLPDDGRIDVVTSSATARLGNPITFALQDETGLYTKANGMVKVAQTMRRGLAGMGGRSMEHTNAPDPSENSTAQQTIESRRPDIFRFHRVPPAHLSYRNKVERARIHRYVYEGSDHVDLEAIEGEAAELLETDPAQAERFFGNRIVAGAGTWLKDGRWADREDAERVVPEGAQVCGGFDGSDSDDWTALRLETRDGFGFTPTYGPENKPTIWNPAEWGGSIPRDEVHAAMHDVFTRYKVERLYCDPPDWRTEIGEWSAKYGEEHVVEWPTYRTTNMHDALDRAVTDLGTGRLAHDACTITATHVDNARKRARPGQRYILGKPTQHQKIDAAMAMVLAHEAASDVREGGWPEARKTTRVPRRIR